MRRTVATLMALMIVASVNGMFAQAKVNFAGTWTLVQDPGRVEGAGAGRLQAAPASLVITHDDKALTIGYPEGQTRTIAFDDAKCRNTVTSGGFRSAGDTCAAIWEGARLVVALKEANVPVGTEIWLLDADGNLVHRFTPSGSGRATTDIYRKTK